MNKSVINPYSEALSLIGNRLRFDINPANLRNYRRLKAVKNSKAGEKCIVICNGPSLKEIDLDGVAKKKIFTIGLNKINLFYDQTILRPDLIVAINEHVIEQNMDYFSSTGIPTYLEYIGARRAGHLKKARSNPAITFLHAAYIANRFAKDVSISVCPGFTVTYVAMQVAYHYGFSDVALIGCDHNFAAKGQANKLIVQDKEEESHFIKNYFPPGAQWQLPDLIGSEFHYQLAREAYDEANRRLVNCTVGGKLEVFPRMSLDNFMNS